MSRSSSRYIEGIQALTIGMPKTYKLKLTHEDAGEESVAELSLEESQLEVAKDFVRYAEDLQNNSLVQEGLPSSFHLTWIEGEGVRVDAAIPGDEPIDAMLMRLRPVLLDRETTSFYRIRNLIAKSTDSAGLHGYLESLRSLFSGQRLQSVLVVGAKSADFPEGAILNSDQMLDIWLNGCRFHRDKDKQRIFASMNRLLPPAAATSLFLMLIAEKIKAIVALSELISVVVGERKNIRAWVVLPKPPKYIAYIHASVPMLSRFEHQSGQDKPFEQGGPWQRSYDWSDAGPLSTYEFFSRLGELWMSGQFGNEMGDRYCRVRLGKGSTIHKSTSLNGVDLIVTLRVEAFLMEDPLSLERRKPAEALLDRIKAFNEGRRSTTVMLRRLQSEEELSKIGGVVERVRVPRLAYQFANWPLSAAAVERIERLRSEGRELSFEEVEGTDITAAWEIFEPGADGGSGSGR